jgi:hypothetical protein
MTWPGLDLRYEFRITGAQEMFIGFWMLDSQPGINHLFEDEEEEAEVSSSHNKGD